jgi:hypothetical protein
MATHEVREIEERRARAEHAAERLGQFIGVLHAARLTALLWIHQAENPAYRYPKKFGLQLAFVSAALTLRKFQDFWRTHLVELLPPGTPELGDGRWVVDETHARNVRRAANQLLAHYSENVQGRLLSDDELDELYRLTRWEDDEALADTLGQMLERLLGLHAALRRLYALDGHAGPRDA